MVPPKEPLKRQQRYECGGKTDASGPVSARKMTPGHLMSSVLQLHGFSSVESRGRRVFVIFCHQQHVEERSAGGGHDREPGGSGAPAGQREAGVSGYGPQPHFNQIILNQIIVSGRISHWLSPDKLMEETEELSHQRAQREVGLLPPPSSSF